MPSWHHNAIAHGFPDYLRCDGAWMGSARTGATKAYCRMGPAYYRQSSARSYFNRFRGFSS